MNEAEELAYLRAQVEDYRLRELDSLRTELAEAKAKAEHYRAEAERNAQVGHSIAREAEAERARLKERISVYEQQSNASTRPPRPTA